MRTASRRFGRGVFLVAWWSALMFPTPGLLAQGPVLEGSGTVSGMGAATPGSSESLLGPMPGAIGGRLGIQPGSDAMIFGRGGPGAPRVPTSISTPGGVYQGPRDSRRGPALQPISTPKPPFYGTLELPSEEEALTGPLDGLTLEQAIERLIEANLDLRAKRLEIPQARADELTASLIGNPIIFADSQLIPYGVDSIKKPDGPLQYDLNLNQPIDYARKRRARMQVAARALKVQEAQYQDAVRIAVQNLYIVYVDVLAARQAVTYAEVSKTGLEKVLTTTMALKKEDKAVSPDVDQARSDLGIAEVGLLDAQENLRRSKLALAEMLNLLPEEVGRLELRGSIQDLAPLPPPDHELYLIALECRPDVAAYRFGTLVAQANVQLQRANRFQDAYVYFQPYTWQNNEPYGRQSGASWGIGVTAPLPLWNRNQGNIERAKLNVSQSEIERAYVERRALIEVEQAVNEYRVSGRIARRIRTEIEPALRQARNDRFRLFVEGEATVFDYLAQQRKYNDMAKAYLDAAVRHRRSMLALNTAVGQRLLP
jgi:outer membrane protein, heavy metal efflux system